MLVASRKNTDGLFRPMEGDRSMNSFLEMLRPSMTKMNTAIFLFVIFGYLVWPILAAFTGSNNISLGFPMPIREISLSGDGFQSTEPFNVVNIAIDFCFWYVIGAVYLWYRHNQQKLG